MAVVFSIGHSLIGHLQIYKMFAYKTRRLEHSAKAIERPEITHVYDISNGGYMEEWKTS